MRDRVHLFHLWSELDAAMMDRHSLMDDGMRKVGVWG
jgi:hypothetical protein